MARITVEDCLSYVENRFELALLAAKRARQLATGRADALIPWDHHKSTVVALREIALAKIDKTGINQIDNKQGVNTSVITANELEPKSST